MIIANDWARLTNISRKKSQNEAEPIKHNRIKSLRIRSEIMLIYCWWWGNSDWPFIFCWFIFVLFIRIFDTIWCYVIINYIFNRGHKSHKMTRLKALAVYTTFYHCSKVYILYFSQLTPQNLLWFKSFIIDFDWQ